MKPIKILLLAGVVAAMSISAATAQSTFKTGNPIERIHKKSHVDQLEPGTRLVLVCKGSDTVTLIDIKDRKQALELCTEGNMIHCSDCHKKFRIVWRNPTGKGPGPESTMEIVNSHGEPCMFLARIK